MLIFKIICGAILLFILVASVSAVIDAIKQIIKNNKIETDDVKIIENNNIESDGVNIIKPIIEAGNEDNKMILYKDKVVLIKKGFLNFVNHGLNGEKTIMLNSISSIQIKEPGSVFAGFFQISLTGGKDKGDGLLEAMGDENAIPIYHKEDYYNFLKIKEYIENYIANKYNNNTTLNKSDDLIKYAELFKQGLITQEEFDKIKKKILEV